MARIFLLLLNLLLGAAVMGCSGSSTSSGAAYNAMADGEAVRGLYLLGRGAEVPEITEAEMALARSPSDYRAYAKYRDQVYVSSYLRQPKTGQNASGMALDTPVKWMVVNLPDFTDAWAPWWGAAVLAHEAYHLDYPDAPHSEVFFYTADVLTRIGAPAALVNTQITNAYTYPRARLSGDKTLAADSPSQGIH
ncbi:MAG: hypothetical protein VW202_10660 [Halieaceae bacterium]